MALGVKHVSSESFCQQHPLEWSSAVLTDDVRRAAEVNSNRMKGSVSLTTTEKCCSPRAAEVQNDAPAAVVRITLPSYIRMILARYL